MPKYWGEIESYYPSGVDVKDITDTSKCELLM